MYVTINDGEQQHREAVMNNPKFSIVVRWADGVVTHYGWDNEAAYKNFLRDNRSAFTPSGGGIIVWRSDDLGRSSNARD